MTCPTPRKVAHATPRAASRHAWHLRVKDDMPARAMTTYHCVCGFWHVARAPLNKRLARLRVGGSA